MWVHTHAFPQGTHTTAYPIQRLFLPRGGWQFRRAWCGHGESIATPEQESVGFKTWPRACNLAYMLRVLPWDTLGASVGISTRTPYCSTVCLCLNNSLTHSLGKQEHQTPYLSRPGAEPSFGTFKSLDTTTSLDLNFVVSDCLTKFGRRSRQDSQRRVTRSPASVLSLARGARTHVREHTNATSTFFLLGASSPHSTAPHYGRLWTGGRIR